MAPLIDAAMKGGGLEGDAGDLRGEPATAAEPPPPAETAPEAPHLLELSNTTAVLDGRGLLLKLYRRVEEGIHPEMEVLRRFAKTGAVPHTPSLLGVLEYQPEAGGPITIGIVREFVHGEGDAWRLTLDALRRFDHILTGDFAPPTLEEGPRSVVALSEREIPEQVCEMLGSYLETARLMARRTAEMHVALASGADDPAFAPEPFTPMYQRSLYQSMREQVRQAVDQLRQRLARCRRRCASRPAASFRARTICCGRPGGSWIGSTRCASAATATITSVICCRSAGVSWSSISRARRIGR